MELLGDTPESREVHVHGKGRNQTEHPEKDDDDGIGRPTSGPGLKIVNGSCQNLSDE